MTTSWKWNGWFGVLVISIGGGVPYAEVGQFEWWGYLLSVLVFGLMAVILVVWPWYCYGHVRAALGSPDELIVANEKERAMKAAKRARRRLERLERNG